jgi:hypothetical protein
MKRISKNEINDLIVKNTINVLNLIHESFPENRELMLAEVAGIYLESLMSAISSVINSEPLCCDDCREQTMVLTMNRLTDMFLNKSHAYKFEKKKEVKNVKRSKPKTR